MTYDMNVLGDITDSEPDLDLDGTMITGIVKLAQKVLTMLLTDKDTDPMGRGTRIPSLLVGANNIDPGKLENVFVIALGDIKEQLATTYLEGTPDDEKLSSAKVTLQDVEPDWVQAIISITAVSGETTTIEVPKTLTQVKEA